MVLPAGRPVRAHIAITVSTKGPFSSMASGRMAAVIHIVSAMVITSFSIAVHGGTAVGAMAGTGVARAATMPLINRSWMKSLLITGRLFSGSPWCGRSSAQGPPTRRVGKRNLGNGLRAAQGCVACCPPNRTAHDLAARTWQLSECCTKFSKPCGGWDAKINKAEKRGATVWFARKARNTTLYVVLADAWSAASPVPHSAGTSLGSGVPRPRQWEILWPRLSRYTYITGVM